MTIAQDIVDGALRLLGVVDQESTPTDNQRNQALVYLNAYIDSLALSSVLSYRHDDEQVTIAAASTTWGTGGTIATTRPIRVIAARRVDSAALEPEVEVLKIDDYRSRQTKYTSGTRITHVAYDPSYPNGKLYVLGSTSGTLKITTEKPWSEYSGLTSTIYLPPGYRRFLMHALAIELSPTYEVAPHEVTLGIVNHMLITLGAVNHRPRRVANSFVNGGDAYDINTGE